jgi:hypothetical protein
MSESVQDICVCLTKTKSYKYLGETKMNEIEKLVFLKRGLRRANEIFGDCNKINLVHPEFFQEFFSKMQQEIRIVEIRTISKIEAQYE